MNAYNVKQHFLFALYIFLVMINPAKIIAQNFIDDLKSKNVQIYLEPYMELGKFSSSMKTVSFVSGSSVFTLKDGERVYLEPILMDDLNLKIPGSTASWLSEYFTPPPAPKVKVAAIVIDPGHGGRDPGANRRYTVNGEELFIKEKDITLRVALALAEELRKAYPDRQILLTRDDDSFPSLEDRTSLANSVIQDQDQEAVIFISIHVNAALNTRATGFEVWHLPQEFSRSVLKESESYGTDDVRQILNSMREEEFSRDSIMLGLNILESMDVEVGDISPNRGLRAENWFVVRNAMMPSVLVELGYLSNKEEAIRLYTDEQYLQKLTLGIYNGVYEFIQTFEASQN
jgi:N-acetylmuramoyl-L-alanine amidase